MISKLKQWIIQLMTGANVGLVIVMLLVGFSDRIHPAEHPLVSTIGMTFPFLLVANLGFLVFWLIFKWTRAWLPTAGFILSYVPISIYMPINGPDTPPDDALKLVSYNVCGYGGNYKYEHGFEKVLDYLIEEQADIVCLHPSSEACHKLHLPFLKPQPVIFIGRMEKCFRTVIVLVKIILFRVIFQHK